MPSQWCQTKHSCPYAFPAHAPAALTVFILWLCICLSCILMANAKAVLLLLCTLFASCLLLDSHPFSFGSAVLISHFKQKSLSAPKHGPTAAEDAPGAISSLQCPPQLHSLSMHGMQIISSAALCCRMKGMGVFELDLLDNIRSTQIWFHARLLSVLLILVCWYAYYYIWESLKVGNLKFTHLAAFQYEDSLPYNNKRNLWMLFIFSFQAVWLPICSPSLQVGKKKAASRRQTGTGMLLRFIAWWTGLIRGHSGKADSRKGGGSDMAFCFDFLRLLICEWVGWNPDSDVRSREETTRCTIPGYQLRSVTREPPLAPHLCSVTMVTPPNC